VGVATVCSLVNQLGAGSSAVKIPQMLLGAEFNGAAGQDGLQQSGPTAGRLCLVVHVVLALSRGKEPSDCGPTLSLFPGSVVWPKGGGMRCQRWRLWGIPAGRSSSATLPQLLYSTCGCAGCTSCSMCRRRPHWGLPAAKGRGTSCLGAGWLPSMLDDCADQDPGQGWSEASTHLQGVPVASKWLLCSMLSQPWCCALIKGRCDPFNNACSAHWR
jgi:hypothetical protein